VSIVFAKLSFQVIYLWVFAHIVPTLTIIGATIKIQRHHTKKALQSISRYVLRQSAISVAEPLNTYFQDKVVIEDVTAQIENLSSMTEYLDVLGIVGLPQMIKGHTIIVTDEDTVYMKSS